MQKKWIRKETLIFEFKFGGSGQELYFDRCPKLLRKVGIQKVSKVKKTNVGCTNDQKK